MTTEILLTLIGIGATITFGVAAIVAVYWQIQAQKTGNTKFLQTPLGRNLTKAVPSIMCLFAAAFSGFLAYWAASFDSPPTRWSILGIALTSSVACINLMLSPILYLLMNIAERINKK